MIKKQVVFIVKSFMQGGVFSVLSEIANNLNKDTFEIHMVCFYEVDTPISFDPHIIVQYLFPKQKEYLSKNIVHKTVKLIDVLIRLERALSRYHSNAVLVPCLARPTTIYTVLSQLFSKRYIIAFLHTVESEYMKYYYSNTARRNLEKLALKIACAGSNQIIVHSNGILMDLINNFSISDKKIQVVPNPINMQRIYKLKLGKLQISSFKKNKVIFAHVGRLSAEKNHELLINAVSTLKNKYKNFIVVCAGEGDEEAKIRQMIKKEELSEFIMMAGPLSNPFPLIEKAHALILTSHFDASPMVLKEAMACDTPVISVDCPFGPRDILDNGRYGILVPQGNSEKVTDAMYTIIQNDQLRKDLINRGRLRAKEFDIARIIKRWELILANAC